jgi:hypothetical protein
MVVMLPSLLTTRSTAKSRARNNVRVQGGLAVPVRV